MVGETVKKYRMEKGLSLSKLAELADVDKTYLISIERNLYLNSSMQFLERISSTLGVSSDRMLAESPLLPSDAAWDDIISEALEMGLTTEEYIGFLEFTKQQRSITRKQQLPIKQYLKKFIEKKLGPPVSLQS
ncbi:helix-turn-helix domain-containing protein [Bacillus sp. FJAT-45350]|uniref:helix-turn-helix domain-containing protein n=1 Tax=Bacillus sp. FJAT-45350 TaxID=2011014 RepID=UPI000BB919FE|nr:helix-turn-helix transcriptional regulator [Bacillus sp. FJAT-45350]